MRGMSEVSQFDRSTESTAPRMLSGLLRGIVLCGLGPAAEKFKSPACVEGSQVGHDDCACQVIVHQVEARSAVAHQGSAVITGWNACIE